MSQPLGKNWKSSIATKLVGTVLVTIFIPTFICIYFVAQFLMRYEKDNYHSAMNSSLIQIRNGIEERVELCRQSANILAQDNALVFF